MENFDTIIEVNDITMRFNLAEEKTDTIKEYFVKLVSGKLHFNEFYALKNVSFQVKRGEAVALIFGSPEAWLAGEALTHILCGLVKDPQAPLKPLVMEAGELLRQRYGHRFSQAFEVASALRNALTLAESPGVRPVDAMQNLSCATAGQVLSGAIYACIASGEDFDRAMIIAVNHSGRSAAVGALAGAILGLRLGEEALPDFYIECLEPAQTLRELADDLYTGCPMEAGSKIFDLDWDYKYLHGGN